MLEHPEQEHEYDMLRWTKTPEKAPNKPAHVKIEFVKGIPVGVNIAPVVPFLTDSELETILSAAVDAGACHASYVLLRLPWEVAPLFRDWLQEHFPLKPAHVMSRMQQMRGGRDYDSNFATRMRGTGAYAQLLGQRFSRMCARLGLSIHFPALDCTQFRAPTGPQLALF